VGCRPSPTSQRTARTRPIPAFIGAGLSHKGPPKPVLHRTVKILFDTPGGSRECISGLAVNSLKALQINFSRAKFDPDPKRSRTSGRSRFLEKGALSKSGDRPPIDQNPSSMKGRCPAGQRPFVFDQLLLFDAAIAAAACAGLTAVSERGYFGGRPRRLGGGGSVSVSAGLPAA